MFGMTISSSQAKTLVEFINAEKANYIEEKVKGIPNQKNAMKIYKEIHADLEDIKHYADDIIKYARCHMTSGILDDVISIVFNVLQISMNLFIDLHSILLVGYPLNFLLYVVCFLSVDKLNESLSLT